MTLNYEQLVNIIERLSKKIGVTLDESTTVSHLIKKITNQNLFYNDNVKEINFLTPSYTNAFLLKNSELVFKDNDSLKGIDKNLIVSIKMLSNKELFIKDLKGNRAKIPFDGSNVSVFFKDGIPFDIALQLLS